MNTRPFALLMCLFACLSSCQKSDDNTIVIDEGVISGKAYLSSYYADDSVLRPLDSQTIYVANSADSSIIYSVQSDSTGKFNFYGLKPYTDYLVFTNPTLMEGPAFYAPYYGAFRSPAAPVNAPPGSPGTSIVLITNVDHRHYGLNIVTTDSQSRPIANVSLIFYASKKIAQLDTFLTGKGSFDVKVTDAHGKALLAYKPESYFFASRIYMNAYIRYNSGFTLKVLDSADIEKGRFVKKSIQL